MSFYHTSDSTLGSRSNSAASPSLVSADQHLETFSRGSVTASSTFSSSQTRPRTSTVTHPGISKNASVVCAVIESRGTSPTVGLACLDLSSARATLCQIADNQTYARTVHKLGIWEPSILLVPSTAIAPCKSKLVMFLEASLELSSPPLAIERKYFNETHGQELVSQLALSDDLETVKVAIEGKYYAVACLSAVLQYIRLDGNVTFASHSLRVSAEPSEGSMMVDITTVRSLELVQNSQDRRSQECLFGLLNQTATPMGARLLRSNILQPLTDSAVLLKRYEAIEELCTYEVMFLAVKNGLNKSLDIDRTLTSMVLVPGQDKLEEWLGQGINHVLVLKSYIQSIKPINNALSTARSSLLRDIFETSKPEVYSPVENLINEWVSDDTVYSRKPAELEAQKTFAIKTGSNDLLAIARQVYKETLDDIYGACDELRTLYGFSFSCVFEKRRGYFLKFPNAELERYRLDPDIFVHVVKNKKFIECQTMHLVKLSNKLSCSHAEVIRLSLSATESLVEQIRIHIAPLFRMSDSIALLDILSSFAQVASRYNYIKPILSSTLAIKAARHPIKTALSSIKFIPNDCYAADNSRLQIVTGCNMSGKSTYIRTIALLQIMAQIGSFVPAEHASFPIRNQIYARMSSDDNTSTGVSTFAHEMREMAFILRNVNQSSLVIVDELGRGTSVSDGLAMATAIAEALLESNALIWFVTHFHELAKFLSELSGVTNIHLAYQPGIESKRILMLYRIRSGIVEEASYGVSMGQVVNLPPRVIEDAKAASNLLRKRRFAQNEAEDTAIQAKKRKLLLGLKDQLLFAAESSLGGGLVSWLKALQDEFVLQMDTLNHEEDAGLVQELDSGSRTQMLSSTSFVTASTGKSGSFSLIQSSNDYQEQENSSKDQLTSVHSCSNERWPNSHEHSYDALKIKDGHESSAYKGFDAASSYQISPNLHPRRNGSSRDSIRSYKYAMTPDQANLLQADSPRDSRRLVYSMSGAVMPNAPGERSGNSISKSELDHRSVFSRSVRENTA